MVEAGVTTPPTTADRRGQPKASRVWWAVHQWVGLKLSILLSFILLTGTLAVFSTEIDWLLRPALRVDSATVTGPMNWTGVAQSVAAHAPGSRIARIEAPLDRGFAATATIQRPDGTLAFVYAHPTTGAPLHFGAWGGLPSKIAWCAFGVLLTGLSVSGVAIFGLRLLRAEHQPASFAAVLARAWTGMGWWRWPALARGRRGLRPDPQGVRLRGRLSPRASPRRPARRRRRRARGRTAGPAARRRRGTRWRGAACSGCPRSAGRARASGAGRSVPARRRSP